MSTASNRQRLKTELENLADAAILYYRAFILGETFYATDNQIEQDFISECQARMVALKEARPDPADDPSLAQRLGK